MAAMAQSFVFFSVFSFSVFFCFRALILILRAKKKIKSFHYGHSSVNCLSLSPFPNLLYSKNSNSRITESIYFIKNYGSNKFKKFQEHNVHLHKTVIQLFDKKYNFFFILHKFVFAAASLINSQFFFNLKVRCTTCFRNQLSSQSCSLSNKASIFDLPGRPKHNFTINQTK